MRLMNYFILLSAVFANVTAITAQPPQETSDAKTGKLPLLQMPLDEFVAQHGGLTHLKLQMKDALPDEIAGEVEKQTGLDIVFDENLQPRPGDTQMPRYSVSADCDFWSAISSWNRGDNKVYLVPDSISWRQWRLKQWEEVAKGRAAVSGPCRLLAQWISLGRTRSRELDPANEEKSNVNEGMSIQGTVQFDPRVRPWITLYAVEFTQARDDRDRDLMLPYVGSGTPLSLDANYSTQWNLAVPADDARSISLLRGIVRLVVVARSEHWDADLTQNERAEKSSDGADGEVRLSVQRALDKGRSLVRLHMERAVTAQTRVFANRQRSPLSWHAGDYDSVSRLIRFYDAQGLELPVQNFKVDRGRQGDKMQSVDIEWTLGVAGEENVARAVPAKIALEIPLEWREVDVPFELKDVPLP